MRNLIVFVLSWLLDRLAFIDDPYPLPISIPEEVIILIPLAKDLCDKAKTFIPGTSGEYKRHTVYAEMQKLHPYAKHRDIGLAIELALRH